jgi:protein gp37
VTSVVSGPRKARRARGGANLFEGLVVDLFAGAGGASVGIEAALGRAVDVAVNHNPAAVAMHQANHPHTAHLRSDVWEVDPVEATGGRPVSLLWASPDCRHFSRAKGAKPVSKKIRSLAWVVVKWAAGERHRVFCASLADICEDETTMPADSWPVLPAARERLVRTIRETAHALDWLLLSKRPENFTRFYPEDVLRLCWVGTSVENQARADERIPRLLAVPAAVRFLSGEPLLERVDLDMHKPDGWGASRRHFEIDWVIVGGESGGGSRPFDPAWARDIRDQCKGAGVAFFMKQMGQRPVGITVKGKGGDEADIPADLMVREFPAGGVR